MKNGDKTHCHVRQTDTEKKEQKRRWEIVRGVEGRLVWGRTRVDVLEKKPAGGGSGSRGVLYVDMYTLCSMAADCLS